MILILIIEKNYQIIFKKVHYLHLDAVTKSTTAIPEC